MWVLKKDPSSELDYGFDWNPWLTNEGDSISSSSWTIEGKGDDDDASDLTQVKTSVNSGVVAIWLDEGIEGDEYIISNTITTDAGREVSRSFELRVVKR